MEHLVRYFPVWLAAFSVIAFALMGIDKAKARRGSRRIPVFHHKTRHWYFAVFFPLIAIAQIALCAWLVIKF